MLTVDPDVVVVQRTTHWTPWSYFHALDDAFSVKDMSTLELKRWSVVKTDRASIVEFRANFSRIDPLNISSAPTEFRFQHFFAFFIEK